MVFELLFQNLLLLLEKYFVIARHPVVEYSPKHINFIVESLKFVKELSMFAFHLGNVDGVSDILGEAPVLGCFVALIQLFYTLRRNRCLCGRCHFKVIVGVSYLIQFFLIKLLL